MPSIYAGTYGKNTTAANALNTALLQHPEISRTMISLYPRYSMTYLLEKTRRHAAEKVLGDSSYEWKVMNRLSKKLYLQNMNSYTASAGDTKTAVKFSATSGGSALTTSYFNVHDILLFQNDATGIILTDDGSGVYTVEMIDAIAKEIKTYKVGANNKLSKGQSTLANGGGGGS